MVPDIKVIILFSFILVFSKRTQAHYTGGSSTASQGCIPCAQINCKNCFTYDIGSEAFRNCWDLCSLLCRDCGTSGGSQRCLPCAEKNCTNCFTYERGSKACRNCWDLCSLLCPHCGSGGSSMVSHGCIPCAQKNCIN